MNFEQEHIKLNTAALQEILRMREEALFSWCHPLLEISGANVTLLNLRSEISHIQHFMNNSIFQRNCDEVCFSETKTNSRGYISVLKDEKIHMKPQDMV